MSRTILDEAHIHPAIRETIAAHHAPQYRSPDFRYIDPPKCKKPNRDGWAKCKNYNKIRWLLDLGSNQGPAD